MDTRSVRVMLEHPTLQLFAKELNISKEDAKKYSDVMDKHNEKFKEMLEDHKLSKKIRDLMDKSFHAFWHEMREHFGFKKYITDVSEKEDKITKKKIADKYAKIRNNMGAHGEFLKSVIDLQSEDFWAMSVHLIRNKKNNKLRIVVPGFEQDDVLSKGIQDALLDINDTLKNNEQFSGAFYIERPKPDSKEYWVDDEHKITKTNASSFYLSRSKVIKPLQKS